MSTLGNFPLVLGYGDNPGVRWNMAETELVSQSVRPVWNSAGDGVKWIELSMTLRFLIGQDNQIAGTTTDLTVSALRRELMKPQQELHFENTGSGLIINAPGGFVTFGTPSSARDINWGPRPMGFRVINYSDQSCQCEWDILLSLSSCPDDAFYDQGVLEHCWSVNYGVDASGLTTRTTTGTVQVNMARPLADSRNISDHADRLREQINPPLQPGFRRIPGSFSLSMDKARGTYSVTDLQLESPNVPPPKCVDVDATQTLGTDSLYAGKFRGSLSATYEISSDTQRSIAESMFFDLVLDRIVRGNKLPFIDFLGQAQQTCVLFRGYEVSDPFYSRKAASFRLEYQLICSLPFLVQRGGLWRPVPNTNWARWSASLASTAFNCRGSAGMRFDPSVQVLADLCEEFDMPSGGRNGEPIPQPRNLVRERPLRNETPPPATSWLYYFCWVRLEQIDETIALVPLPPTQPGLTRPPSPGSSGMEKIIGGPGLPVRNLRTAPGGGTKDPFGAMTLPDFKGSEIGPIADTPRGYGVGGGLNLGSGGGSTPGSIIVQRRAPSTFYAYLEGFGARAGHPILPPNLISVGGANAVPCNRDGNGFSMGIVDAWYGCPIYVGRWSLKYLLDRPPVGDLPVMNNPMAGL